MNEHGTTTVRKANRRNLTDRAPEESDGVIVMILNEVYEPLFCGFSYGSRPGRRPHDALDALHEGICRRKINWVLDCDIEGFFDQLPHDKLMEILEKRVKDPRMLRLIRKWLRVGWKEEGTRYPGTIGTPQGSVISPLLANIFLNEVMDKWSSMWRRENASGDMIAVRYVDDAVFGFQREADARRFLAELRERLEAYGMKLHPGNMEAVRAFYTQVGRLWMQSICRRSQKAKQRWTWDRFYRLQRQWIPRPRLCHPYPSQRFDAMYSR